MMWQGGTRLHVFNWVMLSMVIVGLGASIDHALLQCRTQHSGSQSLVSETSKPASKTASDKPSPGAIAKLTEKGYQKIAQMKSNTEMAAFIRRVVKDMGKEIIDDTHFQGVVPFYSGKRAKQSIAKLKAEINSSNKWILRPAKAKKASNLQPTQEKKKKQMHVLQADGGKHANFVLQSTQVTSIDAHQAEASSDANVVSCSASFQDLQGADVADLDVSGENDSELDSKCCSACRANSQCDFWVRENEKTGTVICWMKKLQRGSKGPVDSSTRRGGWNGEKLLVQHGEQYFSQRPYTDASEQKVGQGRDTGVASVADLGAAVGAVAAAAAAPAGESPATSPDAMPINNAILPAVDETAAETVREANEWSSNRDFDTEMLSDVHVGVKPEISLKPGSNADRLTSDETSMKVGHRQKNNKSMDDWIYNNATVGIQENANSGSCSATFQDMSGADVADFDISGKSDSELDSKCCTACGANLQCDFWVREDVKSGTVICWLKRAQRGREGLVDSVFRRGGWNKNKLPVGKRQEKKLGKEKETESAAIRAHVGRPVATNPDAISIANAGLLAADETAAAAAAAVAAAVPGATITGAKIPILTHADIMSVISVKSDSNAKSQTTDHTNYSFNRGMSMEDWNRKHAVVALQVNANQNGSCPASFQDMIGGDVADLDISGASDSDLDAKCCRACSNNSQCDFWVRENQGNGTVICWLKKADQGSAGPVNSPFRRGGWNKNKPFLQQRIEYENGVSCSATFGEMQGSDVADLDISGESESELDAKCCSACIVTSQCEFWVREKAQNGTVICWLKNATQMSEGPTDSTTRRGGWNKRKLLLMHQRTI